MRTSCKLGKRMKKSILCTFGGRKKRLSDAITQDVEEDPREEGVSGSRSRSSVSCDAKRLRTRMT